MKTMIETQEGERSLFSPVIDFLGLGGGFLIIILPVLLFIDPADDEVIAQIVISCLILANFINHPHFAHSYHIFYRDFKAKAYDKDFPLRQKYIFAGIGVPVMLLSFFLYCFAAQNYQALGLAGNVMVFFVGWHYVKQGYGILMVSSVLKRRFFNEKEKSLLLFNAYFVWILSWVWTNEILAERSRWGVDYYVWNMPDWAMWLTAVLMLISSLLVVIMLFKKGVDGLPINGVVAYITSLYIWLIVVHIHPALLLIVPAFHSLQYLVVVWRYEINRTEASYTQGNDATISVKRRLIGFWLMGLIFGGLGFWLLPILMDLSVSAHIPDLVNTGFLFIFWVFINIHHYFIDNVIWKKENVDVGKYLFY